MSQATNTTPATEQAPAITPAAPATNLTIEQVMRILRTRKIVDHTMVGAVIDKGLRIVGRGNQTKSVDNPRVVYNTNCMRKSAMAEAAAHLRNAQTCAAIGDNEGMQQALREAVNVGVLTFSMPADWEQFAPNAMITATVDEFVVKNGAAAGQKGLGLSNVRAVPGITVKAAADEWEALLLGDTVSTPELDNANVIA